MTVRRVEISLMQLIHWGPIIAISVIFLISAGTIRNDLMWWPVSTLGGIINLLIFLLWNVLTLYNYLLAAFKGPGFVPYGWEPVSFVMKNAHFHEQEYNLNCMCFFFNNKIRYSRLFLSEHEHEINCTKIGQL